MRWVRFVAVGGCLLSAVTLGWWMGKSVALSTPNARWAREMASVCREHAEYHARMERFFGEQVRSARQQRQRPLEKAYERLADCHDAVQDALEDLAKAYERLAKELR
jgi:hypothetical protein